MIRLTLYSRVDCPLCEEMRRVIDAVVGDFPVSLEVVDVDADPALVAAYGNEVPVLCIAGRKVFAGRVQAAELRARLAAERP